MERKREGGGDGGLRRYVGDGEKGEGDGDGE